MTHDLNTGVEDAQLSNEPIAVPPVSGSEPEPTPEPEAVTPEPEVIAEPEEDEVTKLRRIIATDVNLRTSYVQDQYGYPPQAPVPQPPQVQPVEPQLPFRPEDYDPYNYEHQSALLQHQVSQALTPALQYIQQLQERDQTYEQQQQQAEAQQKLQARQQMMEKYVPGFSGYVNSISPEEQAVAVFADRQFLKLLSTVDPPLQTSPQVHEHILRQIAPKVKSLAVKLGIGTQNGTPKATTTPSEVYVEPSNAVPVSTANPFDAAYERNDVLGMISAISRKK